MWTNNRQIEKVVQPTQRADHRGSTKFVSLDKLADRVASLFEGAVAPAQADAASSAEPPRVSPPPPPAHLVLAVRVVPPPSGRPAAEATAMIYFKALTFHANAIVAQAH
jgi:hypothetical protein